MRAQTLWPALVNSVYVYVFADDTRWFGLDSVSVYDAVAYVRFNV